jgi:predicted transcriptional regulator
VGCIRIQYIMRETVTISHLQAVRRALDRIAKEDGVSRSDVLRQSLEDFLFVRRFRRLRQHDGGRAASGDLHQRGYVHLRFVKLLLDRNVLAALGARGTCSDLLEHCVRQHVVVSSQPQFREEIFFAGVRASRVDGAPLEPDHSRNVKGACARRCGSRDGDLPAPHGVCEVDRLDPATGATDEEAGVVKSVFEPVTELSVAHCVASAEFDTVACPGRSEASQ